MNQIQICPKCGEVGAPGNVPCDGKPLPPIRPFDHQTTLEKVLRSNLWKPNDILVRGAIALPKCIKAKEYKEAAVWQDRLRKAEDEKKQWEYILELYEQERQAPNAEVSDGGPLTHK